MNSNQQTFRRNTATKSAPGPALFLLAIVVLGAVVALWLSGTQEQKPSHFVIVVDRSTSKINSCVKIKPIVVAYMTRAKDVPDSTITLEANGSDSRGQEPEEIMTATIPHTLPTPFSSSSDNPELAKAEFVKTFVRACETMGQTDRSPIRRAVERAVEHLRALGCDDGSDCQSTVITDLSEESVDKLRNSKLEPIANQGIPISFCGYSDRVNVEIRPVGEGNRTIGSVTSSADISALKKYWIAALAEAPSFDPFCAATNSTAPSGAAALAKTTSN